MSMRRFITVAVLLCVVVIATSQLSSCATGSVSADDATPAAIPVAGRYVQLALLDGDCDAANELHVGGDMLFGGPCGLELEDRKGAWRIRAGVVERPCPPLPGSSFAMADRVDCVRVRLAGRDCEGTLDGRPALNRPQEDVYVYMRHEEASWRVSALALDAVGGRPLVPIRPCTPEEIRTLRPGLPSGP